MPHVNIKTTKPQKAALRRASSSAVEQTMKALTPYFRYRRWLPNGNRYRDNCIERLDADFLSNNIRTADLAKYISASAIPHALDGWSFMGRAIGAHLRGDSVSCRHLAYYGELRAAMSLLATQGVGIFDKKHFVVEGGPSVFRIPKSDGTHLLTWKALAHWSDLKRSSDLLDQIITPGGLSISAWQYGIFSQASFRRIGATWMQRWGLDIQRCADDQRLRNLSSYRPSHLFNVDYSYTESRMGFIKELWGLCEPSGSELFQRLDRHLLRMWIREQYHGVRGLPADVGNADYVREITELVSKVNPVGLTSDMWVEFLCDVNKHPDSILIHKGELASSVGSATEHVEMLARALMLLRLATGACRQLIINSGIEKDSLQFWWHGVGAEMAIWNGTEKPDDTQSLWIEIEQAIGDINQWLITGNDSDMRSFRVDQAPALAVIDEIERVAFWGMGL